MLIFPTITIKVVHSTTIFSVRVVCAAEQCLILLVYLFNVVLKECPLYIVNVSPRGCGWKLVEWCLFALDILSSLKVVYPPQRNYPVHGLLVFQIDVLVLVYSPTTSTVHHYSLIFVNGIATFSAW